MLENGPKQPRSVLLKVMVQLSVEVLQLIETVVEIAAFS